ncbi:MAG: AraC family transcriptional regulator [Pleomorphochaeta sp.]
MSREKIKTIIENNIIKSGLKSTSIKGVELFRVTESLNCAPAIYEPTVVAIVSGAKEAILDGKSYLYDSSQYMCCTMSLPIEVGTPRASIENPLLGVKINLDTRKMTQLALELEQNSGPSKATKVNINQQGLSLASWDDNFTDALYRLLQLIENPTDSAILGEARLRELYYAILKGEAGASAMKAFGVGNEIARSIEYLYSSLDKAISIEDMAEHIGMSRAVFHRKFKQATTLSPIQFMKSMRLNTAAMKLASGKNVNEAAQEVGYVSSSQFSREFKRMYGQSPKQWSHSLNLPTGMI